MKNSFLAASILSVVALARCLSPAGAAEEPARSAGTTPQRYALMVGIDEYETPQASLRGCVNDIDDMKAVITEKFGFPGDDAHIKVLTNSQATRENILAAFQSHLIENAKKHPDGIFLFEYSGHGSHVPDQDGDEADGEDETLVPYGAALDGTKDIRDDEVESLFKELSRYTQNITFIIDACHSGSVTRGPELAGVKVRQLPHDLKRKLPAAGAQRPAGKRGLAAAEPGSLTLPANKRYVLLSGCSPTETSAETVQGDRDNGLMTRSLLTALAHSAGERTYEDVWKELSEYVRGENPRQNPQLEGDTNRVLFADASRRADPAIEAVEVAGRKLTMKAGAAQGIRRGAVVAVYPKDSLSLSGKPLCEGTVTDVAASTASVRISRELTDAEKTGAKVVLVTPNFGKRELKVKIDSSSAPGGGASEKEIVEKLKEDLQKSPLFQVSASDGNPLLRDRDRGFDLAVIRETYGQFKERRDSRFQKALTRGEEPSDNEYGYVIVTKAGDPLFDLFVRTKRPAEAADKIESALLKRVKQESIRALENERSPIKDGLRVKAIRVLKLSADMRSVEKSEPVDSAGKARPLLADGDMVQFEITNAGKTPLYPTVLVLGTGGGANVVYPPRGGAEPLAPGASVKTPVLQAGPPFGMETFKFIATTKKCDFDFLNDDGLVRGADVRSSGGEGQSRLRDMLVLSATGEPMDGEPPAVDEWAVSDLNFMIVPRTVQ